MTKKDWLENSLKLISKSGINDLKIEVLCKKFNLTKGSFYHHFKSQKVFVNELLEFWYETYTKEIIEEISKYKDEPFKQIKLLNKIIYSKNLDIEVEFRAWGLRDKNVLKYIEKIDNKRILVIESIQNKIFPNNSKEYNQNIALYIYSQFIGSLFIQPQITKDKQKGLDNIFLNLLQDGEKK
ncbi:TetR/AcrR family transcriptional regulator [Arcobacter sp. LA11]|uniref:TetR/AcrR family transcriptional regulator n=1 Tax=Arcobacter sp. LA11 TaxID=1898176 RepID=UPI000932E91F|nr:TetR/AcrR family transcriptional regulator [Arcobacter sp. LA11]